VQTNEPKPLDQSSAAGKQQLVEAFVPPDTPPHPHIPGNS
jgi:hypothetical protein